MKEHLQHHPEQFDVVQQTPETIVEIIAKLSSSEIAMRTVLSGEESQSSCTD